MISSLQLDKEDWGREARQMEITYENAYLTIVPLSTRTSHESFLQRTRNTVDIHFQSEIRQEITGSFSLCHVPSSTVRPLQSVDSVFDMETVESTWHQRGWTFQEKEFSARILYFGHAVMFFRCHDWIRMENDEKRYPYKIYSFVTEELSKNLPMDYTKWDEVVLLFSDRSLSYASDKLPAISALARRFGEAKGDEYVAGLWYRDIHRGLLWEPESTDNWDDFLVGLNTPTPYIAPSWSWASRNAYVEYQLGDSRPSPTRHFTPEFKIVDIWKDVPGANPFGAVEGARLTLVGKLVLISCALPLTSDFDALSGIMPWNISKGLDLLGSIDFDWITSPELNDLISTTDLSMLLVASWRKSPRQPSDGNNKRAYGLVLLPTGNESEYRRVGVFSLHKGGKYANDTPWNNRLFRGQKPQTVHLV